MEFILIMTSLACPEQYDVFLDEKQVGYLRMRHRHFYCDFEECGGKRLLDAYLAGDWGRFQTERQRDMMLRQALTAIAKELGRKEKFTYSISTARFDEEWDEGMSD